MSADATVYVSIDIGPCVTLALAMIDSREAAIIRDRYWRSRTWPTIARERRCSITTATKRFHQGMDNLRRAIILIEGQHAPLDSTAMHAIHKAPRDGCRGGGASGSSVPDSTTSEWRELSEPPA